MPDLSYFNQSIPLANRLALSTITAYLLSLVVPFVERLPFAHDGTPLHDPIIRLLNFLVDGWSGGGLKPVEERDAREAVWRSHSCLMALSRHT